MDPRRMTPKGLAEAEALLRRAARAPAAVAASDALDELMRRLIVLHRLLEAERRLLKAEQRATTPHQQHR